MKTKQLNEGQIVHNYGKQFIARNVRKGGVNALGQQVWHYNGECTADPCNDSIRESGYNGATYSWRAA
jgi:hypothetical protein